jgi:hypothetical protein
LGVAVHLSAPFAQNFLVHVTDGCDFDVRHSRIAVQVIFPAIAKAADRDADAIVCAKDPFRVSEERGPPEHRKTRCRFSCGLEKISPRNIRLLCHGFSYFCAVYVL